MKKPAPAENEPLSAEAPHVDVDQNLQTARREGLRAGAQKTAATRHGDGPQPAAKKVPGASGREGTRDLKRRVH
jgi:hypothetical protein